jgi:hypothetical protein
MTAEKKKLTGKPEIEPLKLISVKYHPTFWCKNVQIKDNIKLLDITALLELCLSVWLSSELALAATVKCALESRGVRAASVSIARAALLRPAFGWRERPQRTQSPNVKDSWRSRAQRKQKETLIS